MSIITTRAERRQLARLSAKQPETLTRVLASDWPEYRPEGLIAVWRSRDFLVQLYTHEAAPRLSVLRTSMTGDRWTDGITWDELQRVKRECGFGDRWAVECYPADSEIVNVGNLRHLWLLDAAPEFGWTAKDAEAR